MSQNTSQSPSEQSQDEAENPYTANQQSIAPDLDANAPSLRSADIRRLNRKALIFLAAIAVPTVLIAIWLFGRLTFNGEQAESSDGEQVVIPDAPKDSAVSELPAEARRPESALPLAVTTESRSPALPMLDDVPSQPSGPSLLERRMQSGAEGGIGSGEAPGMMSPDAYAQMLMAAGNEGQRPAQAQPSENVASAQPLYNPDTLLVRGTYIRCVLETRLITDVPGFTSCVVTEPVYSINGRRLLLPQGSKVSGKYGSDTPGGNRVAVVWDRITTPSGLDVNMRSPGVDGLGGAGHPGHYDAHWPERISSALLISMLSDAFKYAGAKHGPQETSVVNGAVVQSPYESNSARTLERLANMALDKSMSRPATVTINQGTVVNIYVAQDVDFSMVLR